MPTPTACGSRCCWNLKRYDDVIRSCDARCWHRGSLRPSCTSCAGWRGSASRTTPARSRMTPQALDRAARSAPVADPAGLALPGLDAPRLALCDFEELLRLHPSDGDAYTGRGSARCRLSRHREAVADAEEALRTARRPRKCSTRRHGSTPRRPSWRPPTSGRTDRMPSPW